MRQFRCFLTQLSSKHLRKLRLSFEIGDACLGSGVCSYDGTEGTCATQFPGGLCTLTCSASCPSSSSQAQTFCADFGAEGGFCLAVCNPSDPQCRAGYVCESVKQFGDTAASEDVCFPM